MKKIFSFVLSKLNLSVSKKINFLDYVVKQNRSADFYFLQIGANNGKRFDPIYKYVIKYNWQGIAVEPIKEYFDELRATYERHPSVSCCNKAIFEKAGLVQMYKVKPEAARQEEWKKGIASLDSSHHLRSNTPKEDIISETVEGITFLDLLKLNNVQKIDLLAIDTEGYDYKILKMASEINCKPKIILFEHGLRDAIMTSSELSEIIDEWVKIGYKAFIDEYDCILYR